MLVILVIAGGVSRCSCCWDLLKRNPPSEEGGLTEWKTRFLFRR